MSRRLMLFVVATCFIVALVYEIHGGAVSPQSAAAAGPSSMVQSPWSVDRPALIRPTSMAQAPTVAVVRPSTAQGPLTIDHGPRPVLAKYCITCHNQKAKVAGLALDTLDLAQVGEHAEIWEDVARKLRTGAMPPVGRPRPDKATASGVVTWLETELDRAAFELPNPGRPTLHRLNRAEYQNAIRDLLGLEIDAATLLPADVAGYGFDNNADALTLSPALTDRYLGAAAKISQMALGQVRGSPTPDTFFVPTDRNQGTRFSEDLPFGSRGGLVIRYYFPVDGEYQFQLRPMESGAGGGFMGITAEPHQIDLSIDGVKAASTILGGPEFAGVRGDARDAKVLQTLQFRVPVKAGLHLVQAYFVATTSATVEDLFDPSLRRDPYRAGGGEPAISSLTIAAPPSLPSGASAGKPASYTDTPVKRKLFVCVPAAARSAKAGLSTEAQSAAVDAACAKKIIATLARRAYRRPVTDEDLRMPLARYSEGASKGGFDSGLEMALRSILVSPKFLFRLEQEPIMARGPSGSARISDLDLASRLSFFLWSSIPDDELLSVAEKKTLRNPGVLEQQVRRMLADPRSSALVKNFAGQWLHIRNVAGFRPSPETLFRFDDNLRHAFQRETELFFESIISENRSVVDLLDADYTFLNERLARHYGIPGVYGTRFRRVSLPADSVRRGLMGQGSILTGTSRANRTSPVIRGKWILENIFGAPPPPPPPNVPELKDERDPRKVLSMREQMAAHRANPACAGCHAQMDELGFALENFDAIGEWRDLDVSGVPIDPSAKLPDGTVFKGPTELRKVLLSHSDEFVTTVIEKMMTYALGRGLEAYDAPAVRKIKRDAARTNHRFAALIQGVVSSTPFQMKLAQANSN